MKRLKLNLAAMVFGAAAFAAAPFAQADNTPAKISQLSPDQMQLAAELNLRNGEPARALGFADALLQRNPDDVQALLVRAYALRALGEYAPAQQAARAGWSKATTDSQKFTAAMGMAQALSSDGKRTRAQLWLRRAAQVAPTPQHAKRAAQDFRYVRKQNPWQTHLSFTLAPNSNINNGSARDSSSLLYQYQNAFGIDSSEESPLTASNKALSGIEAGFNMQSRYRFHQTSKTAHDLRFGLSYRTYQLSQSSKDDLEAEDADRIAMGLEPRNRTGSDYAYGKIQLGYGYKKLRKDRRGEFSFSADVGQSFYGGSRYNHYLRGRIGQSYYKDAKTKFDFGLSADLRSAGGETDQNLFSLSAGMSRSLSEGNGLYLGVAVSTNQADVDSYAYDELSLRSGYVLGREVMGTKLRFGLNTSYRDYGVSPHDASGRRDFTVAAEVTATFKNIDYYGFNPTVSLSAATTSSNIGLYDVNRVGLGIGIASSF